jgi:hypothetical protein
VPAPADERHDGQAHDEQQRPDDVELLLDRQRPVVLERRGTDTLDRVEVVDALMGEVHVGSECRGPERVDDHPARVDQAHPGQREEHGDDRDQGGRRQDAPGPAGPERAEGDRPGLLHLSVEESGDQEARDDVEDVHADEAAGQERDSGVGSDDSQDCDRSQPLDVSPKLPRHRPANRVSGAMKISTADPP